MISISNVKSASHASHYYEKDDYYAKDSKEHQADSSWYGKGAKLLGLKGEIEQKSFKEILSGKLAGQAVLGRKEGEELVHAPGIDITFSAPKSVSIMAEVYQDKCIFEAQQKAVLKTLDYIEKNLVETRKMKDGVLMQEKVENITAATFMHHTSRNQDPQLHTHCVIANAVLRKDGEWRSAFFGNVFDDKLFLGQIYRSELALELKELGYELRIKEKGLFELKNIDDGLIKAFSSRSKEIANASKQYDNVDAKLKAQLTLQTRQNKKEIDKATLQERWQETLNTYNKTQSNVVSKTDSIKTLLSSKWEAFRDSFDISRVFKISHIKSDPKEQGSIEERAIKYAIKHLSERNSIWEQKDLLGVALSYSVGESNVEKLKAALDVFKLRGDVLEAKGSIASFKNPLTTALALDKEIRTIELMRSGINASYQIADKKAVAAYLESTSLNKGQREAAELILTSKDRVIGVQGYAGTGKTYMLQHVKALGEERGYKLLGLAPSTSAALTLNKEAGIESQTIHKFLFKYNGVINDRGTEQGRVKMSADLKNTVVVVDESSLASTSQMNAMLKLSRVLDFKVVLVGDTKQLNAVEAGKPFYQLQKAGMETAIMGNIVRQKDLRLKEAVYGAINQDITRAFEKLGDNVLEVKCTSDDKFTRLGESVAERWIGLSNSEREKTIVIAPSHKLRSSINDNIRESLKAEGSLGAVGSNIETLVNKDLTTTEKSYISNYEVGDVVLFNRDYKSLRVKQGEVHTILGIKKDSLVLKSSAGKEIRFNPARLGGTREGAIDIFYKRELDIRDGDLVRWTRNYQDSKEIVNTKVMRVLSITDKEISFKTGNDSILKLPRSHPSLRHLDYGYAVTAHAAQGMTYDRVIAALESMHKYLTNQKSFYVTLSRARHEAILFTDNKKALINTLQSKTGELVSATEHQALKYKESDKAAEKQVSKTERIVEHKVHYPNVSTQDIYKAMYSRIPNVLPEFGFRQRNGYYISTTSQKVDGSSGKKGKVYVYANNPGVLVDYTRGNQSVWDYVKNTYLPAGSKAEVMAYLSDMAGLSANDYKPTRTITPKLYEEVKDRAQETKLDSKMLKSIEDYASKKLFANDNKVLSYLKKDRGYDTETIKKMGIGYIDSKKALAKYLRGIGHSEEHVKEALKALHYIGRSHNMVMPFKDDKGTLIGFAARNINYKETDQVGKYLYTKGLARSSVLLGLDTAKNSKEVTIVEGMLDCAHAKAKGIENVVSLGGSSFNDRQLKLLTDSGVKTIVLALDNDKAGKDAAQRIEDTVKASRADLTVKVAQMPSAIKDPDLMIKTLGADAFKEVISNANTTVAQQQQVTDINKVTTPPSLHHTAKPATINKYKDFDMAE